MSEIAENAGEYFLSRAAFLRREMLGRELAIQYLKENAQPNGKRVARRLVYIFDTTVLVSYCAPWIAGPVAARGANGLGAIFPAEWASVNRRSEIESELNETHATLVVKALAEFALLKAPDTHRQWTEQGKMGEAPLSRQPILMFGAHYEESRDIYRVVASKAQHQVRSLGQEDVLRREAHLSRNVMALLRSELPHLSAPVPSRALNLVDFLIHRQLGQRLRGAPREWDRYVRLSLSTGGVYQAGQAGELLDDDPNLRHAFGVLNGDLDDLENRLRKDLINYWRRQLDQQKTASNSSSRLTDAEALSDLFLVNRRLEKKGGNTRVVLVTGDAGLVRAAYRGITFSRVSFGEPNLRDFLVEQPTPVAEEFSLRYMRHLWAYIEDALTGRDALKSSHVVDFFNGLLAKGADHTSFSPEATERIALFPRENRDLIPSAQRIDRALDDWIALSTSAIRHSSLSDFAIDDAFRREILRIVVETDASELDWSDMLRLIQEKVDQEQDRLTTNLSDTGIGPLVKAGLLGARNPPDLNFSSFPNTQAIFEKLSRREYKSASQFEHDFSAIATDCVLPKLHGQVDDRQLSYLKFVVLGAAFASADKWSVALEHAAMARAILERRRGPVPHIPHLETAGKVEKVITGREAFFLSASAQRIVAEGPDDFKVAERYLDGAIEAMKKKPQLGVDEELSHRARFSGELLALRLARYYFERSLRPADPCNRLFLEALMQAREVSIHPIGLSSPSYVRDIARTSIATNFIQVCVISRFRQLNDWAGSDEASDIREKLPECLGVLRAMVNLPSELQSDPLRSRVHRLTCSNLMIAYFIAGVLVARSTGEYVDIEVDSTKLMDHFPTMQKSVVTSYDNWRYEQLLAFCRRIVTA